MDKAHPLSTPMVVHSLDVNKDPFRPQEKDEEILGSEVPYSSAPTRRHWNRIKHILFI